MSPINQGLTKESVASNKPVAKGTPDIAPVMQSHEGIPLSIYNFFGKEYKQSDETTQKELRTIHRWATRNNEMEGDMLLKIRNAELRLGSPGVNQSRHEKLYNWIRIHEHIEDLEKQAEAYENGHW